MAGTRSNIHSDHEFHLAGFPSPGRQRPVLPFLLGALLGGLAGTVLGSLVAGLLGDAISSLFRSVSRKVNPHDQPPFDLLLQ
jgi:cell division protein FtsX